MQTDNVIQEALRHVHSRFPEVTQVFYGTDGRWLYCGEAFEAPDFADAAEAIDDWLLERAANAAYVERGLPCAYPLVPLEQPVTQP